jgi:molecular chaperone DnaK (HSP70)
MQAGEPREACQIDRIDLHDFFAKKNMFKSSSPLGVTSRLALQFWGGLASSLFLNELAGPFGHFIFMLLSILSALVLSDEAIESRHHLGTIIGIDLGTTHSCVAVYQNNQVHIIPNEIDSRLTPSIIAFTESERLIGGAAKHQMTANPQNTIFSIKRLMGLRFSDAILQSELKGLPYRVVHEDNRPLIEVEFKGDTKRFSPEEISGMILAQMKTVAEAYLGVPVTDAVVTVPGYFTHTQRKATMDAGAIAGLNVIRILNEPMAAALAYGFDKMGPLSPAMKILVFDLGGGTFDVSVLEIEDGKLEVLATNGDTHLGGEDFDQRVVDYLKGEYEKKTAKNLTKNPQALVKLKGAAEEAKHALSSLQQATIEIENLNDGDDFVEILTRARFEDLNFDLFQRTIALVQNVINDSRLSKSEIQEIVLVGGSTRIPKIQELVRDFFDGKEPSKSVNPDEAMAHGAAIQAAGLSDDQNIKPFVTLNVNPLTVGIETVGGVMNSLIPRNSRIPIFRIEFFSTYDDNQETARIEIFEGEQPMTRDNHLVGGFDLDGIKPDPRGCPKIEVYLEVDINGMTVVSAEDRPRMPRYFVSTGLPALAKVSDEQQQVKARLEDFLSDAESQVRNEQLSERISAEDKEKLTEMVNKGRQWLQQHSHGEANVYQEKFEDFQEHISPLLGSMLTGELPEDPLEHDDI